MAWRRSLSLVPPPIRPVSYSLENLVNYFLGQEFVVVALQRGSEHCENVHAALGYVRKWDSTAPLNFHVDLDLPGLCYC